MQLTSTLLHQPWDSAKWEPQHGTTRKAAFQRTYYPSEQGAADNEMARIDAERIQHDIKTHGGTEYIEKV